MARGTAPNRQRAAAAAFPAGAADGRNRVAIFGGGPGGLSAALELVERGFEVDLYEKKPLLGGKSRSETVPGSGTDGRKDLPIESGPHAYWGTYPHWNNTLSRVPAANGEDSVLANLTTVRELLENTFQQPPGSSAVTYLRAALSRKDPAVRELRRITKLWELPRLLSKLTALATSGMLRQYHELEHATLVEYTGPVSQESFELLALVVAQVKVAPDQVSARQTARNLQIFSAYFGTKGVAKEARTVVGITRGPANEAVFDPFGTHLEKLGVRVHLEHELLGFDSAGSRITGARVRDEAGEERTVEADWYIFAAPQDIAARVLDEKIVQADSRLGRLDRLGEQWLGAANLILKGPLLPSVFVGGPWQLAVVDYSAVIADFGGEYGDGTATQWVSLDLQTWDTPGIVHGKTAKECTKEEFLDELLAHTARVSPEAWGKLDRDDIIRWDVSRLLRFEPGKRLINDEPLFGAVPGTWSGQPNAVTAVDNLFVGATFARTTGGIDSMDSACEAARRSVGSILDKTGTPGERPFVDSFEAKGWLKRLWDYDDRRYRKGLPNVFDRIKPFRAGQHWRDDLAHSHHDSEWPERI
ncbi:MAG: FAD-dependent oxidoreductase [Segniliparus sp.]|uniref:FAD-dependent oxidoreductase n=1 Tax=Segniliparus sp. TaxID=2804064 RepID=UPI003F2B9B47